MHNIKPSIKLLNKVRITFVIGLCGAFINLPAFEADISHTVISSEVKLLDTLLVNQHGENVRFYTDTVKDKIVVINFIFTDCKMVCPLLGYNFGQLQRLLSDKVGKEIFLISVSVDPVADTPEKLKRWAAQFGHETGWTLLTGDKTQIDVVLKAMESFTADKIDHTSLILMGNDSNGEWKRLDGSSPAKILASELADWLKK